MLPDQTETETVEDLKRQIAILKMQGNTQSRGKAAMPTIPIISILDDAAKVIREQVETGNPFNIHIDGTEIVFAFKVRKDTDETPIITCNPKASSETNRLRKKGFHDIRCKSVVLEAGTNVPFGD